MNENYRSVLRMVSHMNVASLGIRTGNLYSRTDKKLDFLFWGIQPPPSKQTQLPIQNLQPYMKSSNFKITPQCQKDNSDKSPFYKKHWIFLMTN